LAAASNGTPGINPAINGIAKVEVIHLHSIVRFYTEESWRQQVHFSEAELRTTERKPDCLDVDNDLASAILSARVVSVRQCVTRMPKTFFITTAIYYTNSSPHVGHAYEMVLADVLARYHRLKGEKVFFLTGVDQHGQKVQQSAAKAGVAPAEFVKGVTQEFIDLGKKLDVQYDDWAETTSDRHKKVVQGILQRLFEEGQIYKDKQSGYYSVRQNNFN
jgi:leucyl-tRNA synthetase